MGSLINLGGRKKSGGNGLAYLFGAIGVVLVLMFGLPAISDFAQDMGWTGGGGDGGGIIPDVPGGDDKPVAYNVWDYPYKASLQAPDVNLTIEDARFYSTESATNPTTDNIYVYWFTENPLFMDPTGSEYSYHDRLRLHITDQSYIEGTSGIDWGSANQEVIDQSTLTSLVTNPASYGETDGIIYGLLWDNDYVDGTISASYPNGWPVVIAVDLRSIPAYDNKATTIPDHIITFGKNMKGIKQVWPAEAGGASDAWSTASAGWPETGSVTFTDTNSTASNYVDWAMTFADGGVYFWDPVGNTTGSLDTICRIKANSTTMTFSKVEIEDTEVSYIEVTSGGYTELYVKIPREYAQEGKVCNVKVTYGTTEASTYLKIYPFIGEYNAFESQSLTSSLAKVFQLAPEDSDDGHCT